MLSRRCLIPVLTLAALAIPASAGTVTYSTLSAYQAATTALNNTFVNFTTGTGLSSSSGLTDLSTGILFADQFDQDSRLTVNSSCLNTCAPNGQISDNLFGFSVTQFPANAVAFGLNLPTSSSGQSVTISFSANGSPFSTTVALSNTAGAGNPVTFFGVTTDAPITNLTIALTSSAPLSIDNFEVGTQAQVQATPESGSLLLIGIGLIGLRLLRRWMPLRNLQAEKTA
jgi:hypothetical protein